ncbi:hypothetical protein FRB94_003662 [Tulasnella sp. JGI-2019a]|nr:hypothetical protein FRB94_003662 [Tulasnella sp. JGI-2019a]
MSQKKILFVFTSVDTNLEGGPTGWYLPEAAHPYYVLTPKYNITFASPKGPNPPLDPTSAQQFKDDDECTKFLADPEVKKLFAEAKTLDKIDPNEYAAIFYPGGHGPVIDLPTDQTSINLINTFYRAGKPTSAVCHGPAALVNATDANGVPIFKGRRVTGFSNEEETQAKALKAVPFLLEDRIKELGGTYEKADAVWGEKVVVVGNLITGQNPASARAVGQELLKMLS